MNSANDKSNAARHAASNEFGEAFRETTRETALEAERMVIPVVGEELVIDKQVVEAGKVRIAKRVREDEKIVDVPVLRESVEVERVAVNQFVSQAPGVRYEGETMIIPVLREELVVEKRLFLVEELRVTKRQIESSSPQRVTLLREEVQVERDGGGLRENS